MRRRSRWSLLAPALALATAVTLTVTPGPSTAAAPDPAAEIGTAVDAYGRIVGPGGQLRNPAYLAALLEQIPAQYVTRMLTQVAFPARLAVTAGQLVPGWDVGNPLRAGWAPQRGQTRPVAFTNRHGALLRGHVYAPRTGARDPYTGERLSPPYPSVVITPGSIQGSEGMYVWLAQDLAERGYVVLTFDVQGQGAAETLPHTTGDAFPFCNPLGAPTDGEMTGCPGVPFQQLANFTVGTEDAIDFFLATPSAPAPNPASDGARVDAFNPFWRLVDRRPDPTPNAPGRTTRLAIIGHSLGGRAVSQVQATDRRVSTVVALDKLDGTARPVVPALAVQSEYFFAPTPSFLGGGGLLPTPTPSGPAAGRERAAGFDAWSKAGVDSLLIVPHASTHLEYTDIPLVLPASRYGQALTSVYVQRWLDRYLRDRPSAAPLLAQRFRYLEPTAPGRWTPITLSRGPLLSRQFCSAYDLRDRRGRHRDLDISAVGC
ncbi:alpha/beta hydrolase [Nocardioides sp. R-C-SC26]|uniref:alpha/beta hydrolase n=1 Tax=Nocardioides sp. R-C-SC26 TaxID=2870414 RepID=UPI001E587922|nr:alpha/beta hydrolase [Nocardioides sp. R-C-SC26]